MRNQSQIIDCLIILRQQLKQCDRDNIQVSAIGIDEVLEDIFKLSLGQITKKALTDDDYLSVRAISERIRQ